MATRSFKLPCFLLENRPIEYFAPGLDRLRVLRHLHHLSKRDDGAQPDKPIVTLLGGQFDALSINGAFISDVSSK